MKKWLFLILLIIVVLILLFIPFFLSSDSNLRLRSSGTLISGIASLITMTIAILLYDKYGLQKSRLQRQCDMVIDFLGLIKETRFWLHSDISFLQYKPDSNYDSIYEKSYKSILYFDETYIDNISKLSNYGFDIDMPKSIADKIKLLQPTVAIPIERDKIPSDCLIVTEYDLSNKLSIRNTYSSINNETSTFYDFHIKWTGIIDESKEWLKQHGIDIDELNIN